MRAVVLVAMLGLAGLHSSIGRAQTPIPDEAIRGLQVMSDSLRLAVIAVHCQLRPPEWADTVSDAVYDTQRNMLFRTYAEQARKETVQEAVGLARGFRLMAIFYGVREIERDKPAACASIQHPLMLAGVDLIVTDYRAKRTK